MRKLMTAALALSLMACTEGGPAPVASGTSVRTASNPTGAAMSIDSLTSAAEYKAGANTTLSLATDAPPGSSGESVRTSIVGLAAGTQSFNTRAVTLDLSAYGDAATFRLWVKASSLTNLGHAYLMFWSANGWVAYGIQPPAVDVWQEFVLSKGSPPGSSGSMEWSAVDTIYLRVDASADAPYTGDLLWRDLRISP